MQLQEPRIIGIMIETADQVKIGEALTHKGLAIGTIVSAVDCTDHVEAVIELNEQGKTFFNTEIHL